RVTISPVRSSVAVMHSRSTAHHEVLLSPPRCTQTNLRPANTAAPTRPLARTAARPVPRIRAWISDSLTSPRLGSGCAHVTTPFRSDGYGGCPKRNVLSGRRDVAIVDRAPVSLFHASTLQSERFACEFPCSHTTQVSSTAIHPMPLTWELQVTTRVIRPVARSRLPMPSSVPVSN